MDFLTMVPVAAGDIGISGSTIGNWLIDNVIFVGVVIVAIVIIVAAVTKKPRDAMMAFALCLLALTVVSVAGFREELGDWVRTTFLSN